MLPIALFLLSQKHLMNLFSLVLAVLEPIFKLRVLRCNRQKPESATEHPLATCSCLTVGQRRESEKQKCQKLGSQDELSLVTEDM